MDSIPDHAVEVVKEFWETGGKKTAYYSVEGEEIGCRCWYPSGVLASECELHNGKLHGYFRTWHKNCQTEEDAHYVEGKEHGETKQYGYDGNQLGSYVMEHGTGTDLWFCTPGVISEEREYLDGERHGYERWWNCDNRTVNEESHYWNGIEHGIFRKWNRQGKLKRGFPQYYVMGRRMTKRQYERTCREDPTLPSFVASDNQPMRQVPSQVVGTSSKTGG